MASFCIMLCELGPLVKNLPAMQETQVWSLGWEDALEESMATHSNTLAWRIPWTEEPGRLQSMGSQSRTWLSDFTFFSFSHPCVTTGKTIALTIQTFVSKVMSLGVTLLSRFVIALLPRSKCLLISWLQSPSAVVLEPKKIKSVTVSIFPHLFVMKWWDQLPWS